MVQQFGMVEALCFDLPQINEEYMVELKFKYNTNLAKNNTYDIKFDIMIHGRRLRVVNPIKFNSNHEASFFL